MPYYIIAAAIAGYALRAYHQRRVDTAAADAERRVRESWAEHDRARERLHASAAARELAAYQRGLAAPRPRVVPPSDEMRLYIVEDAPDYGAMLARDKAIRVACKAKGLRNGLVPQ